MKHLLFVLIALGASASALAAERYSIDSRHTWPAFSVNHMGFSMQGGRFNKTSGQVTLDVEKGVGSARVEIDTASLDMGFEDWDKHMKGPDFFNVEKFPTMTFVSDAFEFKDGRPVAAVGTFTLLGVSRPLRLEIAGFLCGENRIRRTFVCGARISGVLKRSEFGMTKYVPAVGDEVFLSMPVEAIREGS